MNNSTRGVLTIISGFSGAGKGTVVGKLLKQYPEQFKLSISATTRKPREHEEHGVHYFFISQEEFSKMVQENAFLEYAEYVERSYGTPRKFVEDQLAAGFDVILEIEQKGAFQVKEAFPEALLIFLTPPTIDELEFRLRNRKTESEKEIQNRLAQASLEAENIGRYDYIVINDEIDPCVQAIRQLVDWEKQKTSYNQAFIEELQIGLQAYRKGE